MSYYRSYFEKNNTIVKDSTINTAKNPNTEIFYGVGYSKFIFKVNLEPLITKINDGIYVLNDNTKHYLKIYNCIFGDDGFKGKLKENSKQRATSFDLVLFKINEYWDEGVGFDFDDTVYLNTSYNKDYHEGPSNWTMRTTNNNWTNEGIYSGSPEVVATCHFDNGNEHINLDITNYINDIIVSGSTNYGLGLAFQDSYNELSTEIAQTVSFFTKYTQTYYEPFVESVFDDRIDDNREDFIGNSIMNLYLYVNKNGNPYDLFELPLVDIKDHKNIVISGLENLTTEKVRKGIYKVSFTINGTLCTGKRFFKDCWKNLTINGIDLDDICQKFVPRPYTDVYSLGENNRDMNNYIVRYSGIKQKEQIKRGEIRKIIVDLRSIKLPNINLEDETFYRIFIKEGHTNVEVFDWTQVDSTNELSFMLDTEYLIPREYYLEIKTESEGKLQHMTDTITFEIVSEC